MRSVLTAVFSTDNDFKQMTIIQVMSGGGHFQKQLPGLREPEFSLVSNKKRHLHIYKSYCVILGFLTADANLKEKSLFTVNGRT